jgi:phosphoglycolate phosphatase
MERYIFFDLDGTLTDSAPGIVKAVTYSLEQLGIPLPPAEVMHKFVGPPLLWSYDHWCGMDLEKSWEAVWKFREYYNVTGVYENSVYDGVPEMLDALRAAGCNLVLATSKPEEFALRILEHFDLAQYFSVVVGSEFDGTRVKKSEVVEYALQQLGAPEKSSAVMIGDREHDIFGAKANGLDSVGVLFGYGSREELQSAGADYIVETVQKLNELLG